MFREGAWLSGKRRTRRAEDYETYMCVFMPQDIMVYNIQERLLIYFVNPEIVKRKRKY